MNPEMVGWMGGGIGAVIGIIGALIGTYFTVKNTSSQAERAFVMKASVVCWVFTLSFVAAMLLIPSWHKHLLWIPYAVLLIVGIAFWNRTQARLRQPQQH